MTAQPAQAIRLHRFHLSGHSHRVELLLSLLGLPYELVDVDLTRGAHKTPAFLQLNPFGQVPVLDDNGTILADSNAILVYLALRYGNGQWLPADAVGAAQVQRWFSAAAGPIAHAVGAARRITVFGAKLDAEKLIASSHALLQVMEAELAQQPWLAGSSITLADIACYSYVAHAPEGNVSLADYPQLRAWLARIEALPGFVPMARSAAGLFA
ncbi:Disulfide-bond oxidoreductase YfcG [Andreprevotia sp. IGB-42]|uniref:glutathione S-transferase family protein n=1 Tax=Andreprevotia sp. IGB-42 TaxID=2497473 RepID=UPI00135771E9|nr:glutathione S-transferase [Andreprevotia sp. IGB-42]KAF0813147.1 Disulfide-bond oxidoreductase YfcG [Andreprevotia sp. IGB-42]